MSCAYRHRERCWRDPQTNPFPPRSSFCALRMPISCTGRGRAQTLRRRVPGPLSSRPKPADRRTGVASRSIPPGSPSGCTFRTQKQWEADIEWDEWKNHVAFPHLHPDHLSIFGTQVSGCRLFLVCEVDFYGAPKLDVYDFTIGGNQSAPDNVMKNCTASSGLYLTPRREQQFRGTNLLSSAAAMAVSYSLL